MTEYTQGWLEIPDKKYFKIGEVAEIIGVKPYILRYWESEFNIISPKKTSGRHRMYNRRDIEILATIKTLLYDQMYTIAGARKRLRELCLQEGGPMAALFEGEEEVLKGALDGTDHIVAEQEIEQLRAANRQLIDQLGETEQATQAAETAFDDLQMAHREALARVEELEIQLKDARHKNPNDALLRKEYRKVQERAATLDAELLVIRAEHEELQKVLKTERENLRKAREAARKSTSTKGKSGKSGKSSKADAEVEKGWIEDLEQARRLEDELRHELKDQLIHYRLFLKRLRSEITALAEFGE